MDAYDGAVTFYVIEPDEPMIAAYARAFPSLFRPLLGDARGPARPHPLPPGPLRHPGADVRAVPHARPAGLLQQGRPLDGAVRKAEGRDTEMEPYYTIMRLPAEKREEFILLLPFTPVRRDNMIAWLAARSDPPDYGKLVLFEFPKGKLVFGPAPGRGAHRPGRVHLPAALAVGPGGLAGDPGGPPRDPHRGVAPLRPAPLPRGGARATPGAQARDRRLRKPDRHGRDAGGLTPAALRRAPRGRGRRALCGRRAAGSRRDPPRLAAEALEHFTRARERFGRGDFAGFAEDLRKLEETLKRLQTESRR